MLLTNAIYKKPLFYFRYCPWGGSRAAATSKMERFVIVNGWKHSILDVAAALDPPLCPVKEVILWADISVCNDP